MKRKEKISYGIGTLGYALENSFVMGYLVLYATDVQKLAPARIGAVLLLPKLLDVVSDVLITSRVDRTRTRFGTYRPWLFASVPLGLLMVFLFSNPAFVRTDTGRLIWITGIYFFMVTIFETAYWCPYAALSGVMSADANDRLSLSAWRSGFESVSGVIVSAVTIPLVSRIGSSYTDPAGWKYVAVLFAVLGLLAMLVCFWGTRERAAVTAENEERLPLRRKLEMILGNRKLLRIVVMMGLLFLPWYGYSTLFSYFCIYNLGHSEWVAPLSLIGICFSIAATFPVSGLAGRLGSRRLILFSCVSILMSMALLSMANSFAGMIPVFLLKDLGQISIYVCAFSLVPEVADEICAEHDCRLHGFVTGFVSSFQKLSAAVGTYLATLILSIGGYSSSLTVQMPGTLRCIRWGIVLLYALPVLGILYVTAARDRSEIPAAR